MSSINQVGLRVPEGGAIEDSAQLTMEEYSEYMYSRRKNEYTQFVKTLTTKFPIHPGMQLLEIGAGPGWISIFLAQRFSDITIDILEPSSDMIRVAHANAKKMGVGDRLTFHQGFSETAAELLPTRYDLIYSNDSLHHWVDPAAAFAQIEQLRNASGHVLIHDSRRDLTRFGRFIHYRLGKLFAGRMWQAWHDSIRASYIAEEIHAFCQIAGVHWRVIPDSMDLTILG